jgi:hypothetical protein
MNQPSKPLKGQRINLSVSASDGKSDKLGLTHVNWIVLRLVKTFISQGAGVVFGHDWRDDGVMEAVYGFAQEMHDHFDPSGDPMMINILPWPDEPRLKEGEIKRMHDILHVMRGGLPENILRKRNDEVNSGNDPVRTKFVRALGLTHMRRKLNRISSARICIGGPENGATGRYPGIIEEAYLALDDNVPLFISGYLGGVAVQLIDALNGKPISDDFASGALGSKYQELRSSYPYLVDSDDKKSVHDSTFDPEIVWKQFAELGMEGLSRLNGLSVEENEMFMNTTSVDTMTNLAVVGMVRLAERTAMARTTLNQGIRADWGQISQEDSGISRNDENEGLMTT